MLHCIIYCSFWIELRLSWLTILIMVWLVIDTDYDLHLCECLIQMKNDTYCRVMLQLSTLPQFQWNSISDPGRKNSHHNNSNKPGGKLTLARERKHTSIPPLTLLAWGGVMFSISNTGFERRGKWVVFECLLMKCLCVVPNHLWCHRVGRVWVMQGRWHWNCTQGSSRDKIHTVAT